MYITKNEILYWINSMLPFWTVLSVISICMNVTKNNKREIIKKGYYNTYIHHKIYIIQKLAYTVTWKL